jgi:hypothetical protein
MPLDVKPVTSLCTTCPWVLQDCIKSVMHHMPKVLSHSMGSRCSYQIFHRSQLTTWKRNGRIWVMFVVRIRPIGLNKHKCVMSWPKCLAWKLVFLAVIEVSFVQLMTGCRWKQCEWDAAIWMYHCGALSPTETAEHFYFWHLDIAVRGRRTAWHNRLRGRFCWTRVTLRFIQLRHKSIYQCTIYKESHQ